jgi:HK97 family phage major capsid protein
MEIKDMSMEQVEARLAEIKTEIDGEGADIEALSAEVDSLEERQSAIRAEAAEKRSLLDKVATMNATPIAKIEERKTEMAEKEFRNSPAYIEKYAEWFKDQDNAEKRAALLTENVDGDIAVPDLVYDEIKTAWNADEIMSFVETLEVRGNLKVNFEISGSDAVKHEEGSGEVTEQTLTEGIATLVPAYFKKWKSFSDEVYSMRGEAFLRYIYRELTHYIVKSMADDLVDQIAKLPETATKETPSAAKISAAPAVGTVAEAMGHLSDEAGQPIIIMNKLTWAAFKAAQYANQFAVDPFEGLEVHYSSKLPAYSAATAGQVYMIVGDLAHGALANMPNGRDIEFTFDNLTRKKEDLVEVLGKIYAAVAPVACGSFTLVAKA